MLITLILLRRSILLRRLLITSTATFLTTTTVEHLHFTGDNLCGVTVCAILPLPLACAQRAFNINLGTFFQIFAGNFTETIKKYHSVPFRALLLLTGILIFPCL